MFGNRSILTEAARPEVIRESRHAPWLAVGVVCFGAFMGQLDASIVTLTFRPMEHAFGAPLAAVQWVSLSYLLTLVGMLAPAGRLSDAVGRKLVYTYGFVVFIAASAACGLASSLGMLIAFRMVQAAGAAMLQSNSVALVTTSAPAARTRFALGVQAGAQSVGLALGPVLGGVLTATLGWRYVYFVNIPVGIIAVVAGRYLLPRTRDLSRAVSFDWAGTLLLAGSTSGLLLVLSAVSGLSLPPSGIGVLVFVMAGCATGFGVREMRARCPLIPVALLRSAPLAVALAGALCGYLALFGPLVLVPQILPGGNVIHTGLLLCALPVGFGVAALGGDAVLPRAWGNRRRGCVGGLAFAVAMAALIIAPRWALVPCLVLAGLGLGAFVPANNTVIMGCAQGTSPAVLGGLVNMARGIGTTLGISLVALVLHLAGTGGSGAGEPGAAASRFAFGLLAIVGVAAAAIAMSGKKQGPGAGSGAGSGGGARGEADAAGAFW
jgi:MFS family permease